jgi:muramoyltetrapeptide carboxypeptidase
LPIKPAVLKPGDTIGIIATSGPVNLEALERGINTFEEWGLRVKVHPGVPERRGYLAGSDAGRASALNEFFADPEVRAIVCARGGYGAPRILNLVDFEVIRRNPKIFCGFSDITALHLALARKVDLVTFHSPMGEVHREEGMLPFNAGWLRKALTESVPLGEITSPPDGPRVRTLVGGRVTAPIVGGNLSLIAALMGTPYEVDTRGKILLLEDIDEAPYRMDRMLMQLHLAGKLQEATGFLFGESVDCEGPKDGKPSLTLVEILEDLLVPLHKPLVYGFPCGHGDFRATVPFGVRATLDADRGTLTIEEAATA